MASTLLPKTIDQWMRRMESRLSRLERRRPSPQDASYVVAGQGNDYAPGFTGSISDETMLHEIYMGEPASDTDTFLLHIDVQIQGFISTGVSFFDVDILNQDASGSSSDTIATKRIWNFDTGGGHTIRDSVDGLFKTYPSLARRYIRVFVTPGSGTVNWQNGAGPSYRIQGYRTPFTGNASGGIETFFPGWTQNL